MHSTLQSAWQYISHLGDRTQNDSEFVGTCALITNEDGENELGYRLLESEWGQGIGSEVCHSLINYCQTLLGLNQIVAYVDSRNAASVRILDSSVLSKVESNEQPTTNCDYDIKYCWQHSD